MPRRAQLLLGDLFEGFSRTAWRLCARDLYDVPEEREPFQYWVRTGRLAVRKDGWPQYIRHRTANGARIGRVQIVTRPVGTYMSWCLAAYPANVAAGEDVRVAYRDELPPALRGPVEDFWLFDDEFVAVMEYDAAGRWLGVTDGTADLDLYRELRAEVLQHAVPIGPSEVPEAVGT